MPWRPLPRIAFAIATFPFQPSTPADLPLELGDELYIIEEGGAEWSWYRGYLVAPPSLLAGLTSVKGQTLEARVFSGIFPRSCVEIREYLGPTNLDLPPALLLKTPNGDDGGSARKENNGELPNGVHGELGENGIVENLENRVNGVDPSKAQISFPPPHPLTPVSMPSPQDAVTARPPAPVPMLKIGDETPTSASEPLVDEIASCLREWHSTNLHELLLSRNYGSLDKLSKLVNQLDISRRQLLHGVLTDQELELLREKTVWDLVAGNKIVNNEIVVRDPKLKGRLLTSADSAIETAKLQSVMSALDKPPIPVQDNVDLHHLMIELKEIVSTSKDNPTLIVCLSVQKGDEPLRQMSESSSMEIPARENVQKALSAGKLRTMFTNLTSMDVGEVSGSDTRLYLVVKVQVNHLTKAATLLPTRTLTARDAARKEVGPSPTSSVSGRGGRRSLMWGSSKGSGSQRGRLQPVDNIEESVEGAEEPSSPSSSSSSRPSTRNFGSQGPQYVKRIVGAAILPLQGFLAQDGETEKTLTVWSPSNNSQSDEKPEDFDELLRNVLASPSGAYSKFAALTQIRLRLHSFMSPDADTLIRLTPTLLHNIPKTQKMGFSGAPTKPRSDIYIRICEPILPPGALFSHPERGVLQLGTSLDMQNLQLTLEIRKDTGERIDRCIFASSDAPGQTAWRSVAMSRGESWDQTFKLVIPTEDVPKAHIIMSIADYPGFPFALGWMPLWTDGAFVQDGTHLPLLHLYDKTTSNTDSGRGAYLNLPWDSKADDPHRIDTLTGPMAALKLESYLCSTTFSQDQVLLKVLKWREQLDDQLLIVLRQLVFVPEIEIVKLVSDLFDSLFAILVDRAGNEEFEDLVFTALVTVLGIVYDRRFRLDPVVKEYAEVRFNYPFATPCLIRSYLRLITRPADYQNSRQLRATFKVGRQIIKFIVIARAQQQVKEASIGITHTQSTFNHDFMKIFHAFEDQMREQSASHVGSKTLIVQHFHTWLPELQSCFGDQEILRIAISFVDSCESVQGKLILHKLVLILNLMKTTKGMGDITALEFNSKVFDWLAPHWGKTDEVSEQFRDQVRLCSSVMASMDGNYGKETFKYYNKVLLSYYSIMQAERPQGDTLSLLFPSTYPFPSKQIKGKKDFDENLVELSALKATIKVTDLVNNTNMNSPEGAEMLFTAHAVSMSILDYDAFPESWFTLHLYHHRILYDTLEGYAILLLTNLIPPPEEADTFNTDLWRVYLSALLRLVRSSALALETFPEQRRRAVWKILGDVREQGAELLRQQWNRLGWEADPDELEQYGLQRLGGYQVQYVPSLVPPIVELCLSVHEGLRRTAVEILQSMIISEWSLNEDLSVIQAEMIDCLDNLFKSQNTGDNVQQRLFIGELAELFQSLQKSPDTRLWKAIEELLATVGELLNLLVAVHTAEQNETFRIMHTLRLMEFLRGMQKEDMYISYVHQLAKVEAQAHNFKEAGLALRLHADLYSWDQMDSLEALKDPEMPKQSSFERKESVYFQMIEHFEEAAAWEPALASYQELAHQYEKTTFDFAKLARTQRSSAKIYETIARGESGVPRYFRVVFRGLGFPSNLRDKQFIYEGGGSERLATFQDRLQQQHPGVQFITGSEIENVERQYLQVTAMAPYRELDHPLYQRAKVVHTTKEFLSSLRTNQFSVTTRRHSPKTGVKDQWVEKTVYTTADVFPTILRRSEIIAEEAIALSPLQTALERTLRKTSELAILNQRLGEVDNASAWSLIEALKTSVDPSSNGSVAQYRDMLPKLRPLGADEDEPQPPMEPLEKALQVSLLDFASCVKQSLSKLSQSSHQVEYRTLGAQFTSTFAPELAVIGPGQYTLPAQLPQSSDPNQSNHYNNPVNDLSSYQLTNGDGPRRTTEPNIADTSNSFHNGASQSYQRASTRNRLSAMLKRSTIAVDATPHSDLPNGGLPPVTVTNASRLPPIDGSSRASADSSRQSLKNSNKVKSSHNNTHSARHSVYESEENSSKPRERTRSAGRGGNSAGGGDAGGGPASSTDALRKTRSRANDEARPVTAQSAVTIGTNKSSGRVGSNSASLTPVKKGGGSIRKRLSTLGIGKKPPRGKLVGIGQGVLVEE